MHAYINEGNKSSQLKKAHGKAKRGIHSARTPGYSMEKKYSKSMNGSGATMKKKKMGKKMDMDY